MPKDLRVGLLLDYYGDLLTEKQRTLVDLYYNQDLSLSEIAENEGITRQGVRDGIKRAELLMLEMEEKLRLAAQSEKTVEFAKNIAALAEKIDGGDSLDEIKKYARQIHAAAEKWLS